MNNISIALVIILMFYILPIVIIKYFNRWTSSSVRLISDNPNAEDLTVAFCPIVNIAIAIIIFVFYAIDRITMESGKIRELLVKIIT